MAEKYDISVPFFKRYLNKLVEHKIIEKRKRKLVSVSCSEKRPDKWTDRRTAKRTASKLHFVTSITFCGWVFGENTDKSSKEEIDLSNELSNVLPNGLHNIEGINIDNLKKEKINIYNAREKNFFFQINRV